MMNFFLITPKEAAEHIAKAAKVKRLSLNLSQKSLSERSGVSFSVLKKFENTGKISLESLLKLALTLDSINDFTNLFPETPLENLHSIDDILKDKSRKRGRK
jgi:transcriptional regulator with XRE-family HTH domain